MWVAYSFIVVLITYFIAPTTLETLIGSYPTEFINGDVSNSLVVGGFGTLVLFVIVSIYYAIYPPRDENKTTSQRDREQK